jgi:hypothetical protein
MCLNTWVHDAFFIRVGDDDTFWGFGIPVQYSLFRLYTDARSVEDVDDLQIISTDGLIEVSFSGESLDLRGFEEGDVVIGDKKIRIDYDGMENKSAVISMYQIDSGYSIYRDGAKCSSSQCRVISYSNKRLKFSVPGFSLYEIKYNATSVVIPMVAQQNISSVEDVLEDPLEEDISGTPNISEEIKPVPKPVQAEPEKVIVDTDRVIKNFQAQNPFSKEIIDNITEKVQKTNIELEIQKNLLMRTVIYGVVGLILLAGLLFYIKRFNEGG